MKIIEGINYVIGKFFNRYHTRINYSLLYLHRKRDIDRNYMDYIRLSTLELIANEINTNNIAGEVAELGVYKGKFARYINRYFPDRKLYLFDTFKGFDKSDVVSEVQKNLSSGEQDFSNTSIDQVLSIMPHRDRCIVKEGFFPDTAVGLEEIFAFVSIDADLYDPIYNGLKYFYPRLQKGGYIFVHDYNNDHYPGSKKAVQQFCKENEIGMMPLPDSCGTAVIVK